jgi:hypothetical protein
MTRRRLGLEKFIMPNQIVTGIGCFAGPQTLIRVFRRIVQSYTLGQFESIRLKDEYTTMGSSGAELLRTLITGKTGLGEARSAEFDDALLDSRITGFFLALKGLQLELAVFAKGENRKPRRYTACLDELVKLRQKRLN